MCHGGEEEEEDLTCIAFPLVAAIHLYLPGLIPIKPSPIDGGGGGGGDKKQ
ncbi:hypothetical protein F4861DRAFT_535456 [Xylaria intraflava]|nr:hypothetical protein F4861DRAFT_535456 [Xylaria intraflava]